MADHSGGNSSSTIHDRENAMFQPFHTCESIKNNARPSLIYKIKSSLRTAPLLSSAPSESARFASWKTLRRQPRPHPPERQDIIQSSTFQEDAMPTYPAAMRVPDEILEEIFSLMSRPSKDLASCTLVCKRWHRILSPRLWGSVEVWSSGAMLRLGKILEEAVKHRQGRLIHQALAAEDYSLGPEISTVSYRDKVMEDLPAVCKNVEPKIFGRSPGQGTKAKKRNNSPPSSLHLVTSVRLGSLGLAAVGTSSKLGHPVSIARRYNRWSARRKWKDILGLAGQTMCNLRRLDLSNCADWLQDDVVNTLVKFCGKTLEDLSLANGYLVTDDAICTVARGCRRLQRLDVSHCVLVGDKGIAVLAEEGNKSMIHLIMTACNIGDVGVMFVGVFCTELRTLDLEDCFMLTQKSLTVILAKCHKLEHIKLPCFVYPRFGLAEDSANPNPVLQALLKRPAVGNLKTLGLSMYSGEEMNTHLPQILRKFPTISTLEISGSPSVSSIVAPALAHLSRLVLASTGQVDDDFAEALAEHCHELTYLDLSHCKVTAVGVAPILMNCRKLQNLCLACNRGINLYQTFTNIKHRLLTSPTLRPEEKLQLALCPHAGPHFLALEGVLCAGATAPCSAAAMLASPSLQRISLSQIGVLSDDCLRVLPVLAPKLVELDVSHCHGLVDPRVVFSMAKQGKHLKRINLSGCDRLLGTEPRRRRNGRVIPRIIRVGTDEGLRAWADEPRYKNGMSLHTRLHFRRQ
ncbi:hypothetical protein DFS34DRAFT_604301 [Phlyctochytrium arcticum]|nr:hypothetical protein DFS34DRAFT_604301 [Phlyctochytrium arcticum]